MTDKIQNKVLYEVGQQVQEIRKKNNINRYYLRNNGIPTNTITAIEDAKKGYSIISLIKYLSKITKKGFTITITENENNGE